MDELIKRTQLDKKKRAGSIRYVLLNGLGTVYEINHQFAHPVSDEIVKKAFWKTIEE